MNDQEETSPRRKSRETRRKAILRATRALVIEIGYDGLSLDLVAARSNLTKPTLYKYFQDKDDLLLSAYLEMVDTWEIAKAKLPQNTSAYERLSLMIRIPLDVNFGEDHALYASPPPEILSHPKFAAAQSRVRQGIADTLVAGQASGEIDRDINPLVTVQLFFAITGFRPFQRLVDSGELTTEELIGQLHKMLVRAVRSTSNQI